MKRVEVLYRMNKEFTINAVACFSKEEQKASLYFQELYEQVTQVIFKNGSIIIFTILPCFPFFLEARKRKDHQDISPIFSGLSIQESLIIIWIAASPTFI
jgi:hypothetical protein